MDPMGGFEAGFVLFQTIFYVVLAVVIAGFVATIVKRASQRARDDSAPEVSARAAVVDKRIATSGGGERLVVQNHFISFEQPGGERFELEVPAGEYGLLVVGDRGTVSMKGSRYLGFAREILR